MFSFLALLIIDLLQKMAGNYVCVRVSKIDLIEKEI